MCNTIANHELYELYHETPCLSTGMPKTTRNLQELAMNNLDTIVESGFSKPLAKLDMTHKEQFIHCVCLHKVVLISLAELSQFRDGLYKIEGINDVVSKHSNLLESFYCLNKQMTLTSGENISVYMQWFIYS